MGVVIGSNDIMDLMGLIGVPLTPPLLPLVLFRCCEVCFWFVVRNTPDGAK